MPLEHRKLREVGDRVGNKSRVVMTKCPASVCDAVKEGYEHLADTDDPEIFVRYIEHLKREHVGHPEHFNLSPLGERDNSNAGTGAVEQWAGP